MKKLKTYMLIGAIFVAVSGTLLHFVYEWSGNNAFIGIFVPINESTFEHMKLTFFPMLFFSLFAVKNLKSRYPKIGSSLALGTLIGTYLIPVLFYTYSGILGYNLAVIDISIFFISVIVAFYTACKVVSSCKVNSYKILLYVLLLITVIAFVLFTFYQPNIALFVSP